VCHNSRLPTVDWLTNL
jgi:hypothetical protein